jgi:hypothetical protein
MAEIWNPISGRVADVPSLLGRLRRFSTLPRIRRRRGVLPLPRGGGRSAAASRIHLQVEARPHAVDRVRIDVGRRRPEAALAAFESWRLP